MSGAANLEMIGRLYHLPRKVARERGGGAARASCGSPTPATDWCADYSGGMRRRLDLAASLVASPPVLFLDEPTTGLDPESRNELWSLLRQLVDGGTTVLLTTQYLEEADQLADDVVLLDHGADRRHRLAGRAEGAARRRTHRRHGRRPRRSSRSPPAALERVAAGAAEIDRRGPLWSAPRRASRRG